MLEVTFYGVRGSTPCSDPALAHYGGNTSCVLVTVADEAPIICDLGTGLRGLGADLAARGPRPFTGTALLSHLHMDHVQGVPFFRPLLESGAVLDIYGPVQQGRPLDQVVTEFIAPPLFPVSLTDLPIAITFNEVQATDFTVGSATVTAFDVEHIGPTNGYRIATDVGSVAYVSDCQEPVDGSGALSDTVVDACHGVDVLIHDSQYDDAEFEQKKDWGHCTVDYAYAVAVAAEAKLLVLFHHDPAHDDAWVRAELDRLRARSEREQGGRLKITAAREGMTLRCQPDPKS